MQQGKYGQRFANLKAATVPTTIASFVSTVSLSNVVVAETKVEQAQDVAQGGGRTATAVVHVGSISHGAIQATTRQTIRPMQATS